MNPKFVFRWNDIMESFVFADLDHAISVDKVHRALFTTKTWGELKSSIDDRNFDFILQIFLNDQDEDAGDPALDELIDWKFFDTDLYGQGIFPAFLIYHMQEIIPEDILNKYGGDEIITDLGSYRQVKPEKLVPMISALTAQGYELAPAGNLKFDDFFTAG